MKRVLMTGLVLVCFGMSACAFKSQTEGEGAADQAPPTTSLVRVSWWTADQKKSQPLSRGLEHLPDVHLMHVQTPVTVPAQVPDRIEVELSFPTRFADMASSNLLVQAFESSGQVAQLDPRSVSLLNKTEDWTDVLVDLEGIRKLISDSKE